MVKLGAVFGSPVDEGALLQIETCLVDERAVAGALMADHHLGYSMPIGGVVAYRDAISPSGVGFDIACGNKAVRTTVRLDDVSRPSWMLEIMREVQRTVAFGIGRRSALRVDHVLFDSPVWDEIERLSPGLKDKAEAQLGTVGSGNHYVDLLVDSRGWLWIANHFGSRGFGHTIASVFLSIAAGKPFDQRVAESEEPSVLDIGSTSGDLYVECMRLAGEYAYAGRDHVIEQVLGILGNPKVTMSVHSHHNFAWLEDGLWVVRKGATPLTEEPVFIGGSMGDVSVIVAGTGDDIGALGSAPHGAGRTMSRTKAAGKWKKVSVQREAPDGTPYTKKIRVRDKTTALIDFDAVQEELRERGIVVLGSGADEAPAVYKDLRSVLAQHTNMKVLHTLHPVGVVMAGDDTYDPYKD